MHTFEDRIRAAMRAAWQTIGLAASLLVVQWVAYLAIVDAQPSWFLALWGRGATWPQAQAIWLEAMARSSWACCSSSSSRSG